MDKNGHKRSQMVLYGHKYYLQPIWYRLRPFLTILGNLILFWNMTIFLHFFWYSNAHISLTSKARDLKPLASEPHWWKAFNETIKSIRGSRGTAPGGVQGQRPWCEGTCPHNRVKKLVQREDPYLDIVTFLRRRNPLKMALKWSLGQYGLDAIGFNWLSLTVLEI